MIIDMDKDGDGVSQEEFVIGMLAALGTITQDDIDPWMRRFRELDKDRSGRLDSEDLQLLSKRMSFAVLESAPPSGSDALLLGHGQSVRV
mmetsp:Transcript_15018/g.34676  ORF Transcript_15018/g.34676 Transcript_15018/m.34676 type:complete len:90 (+) Transcript_15018:208-477(+)